MKETKLEANTKEARALAFRLGAAEARHRALDERVTELGRRAILTMSEQREIAEMKRAKLRAKDEITTLRRALG